jgi:putative phosphoesterase
VASKRIGLIADTHMPGTIGSLWPSAIEFLKGSDAILHAGDLHTLDVVDELIQLAPTYVSEGNGDRGILDDRVKPSWRLSFEDFSVGMVHHCPSPERKDEPHVREKLSRYFDTLPDIIVFGHTHLEMVHRYRDLTLVNPGSPTLPRNQSLQLGTLGEIIIDNDQARIRLVQLTENHWQPHGVFSECVISKSERGSV